MKDGIPHRLSASHERANGGAHCNAEYQSDNPNHGMADRIAQRRHPEDLRRADDHSDKSQD